MDKSLKGVIIIEGHVQGLSNTRSIGEKNIPVIVVDTGNCIARYSKYCKSFFKCPAYYDDKLADFLIELAVIYNLNEWLLLPSNDHAVHTIARNKKRLLKYYKIITADLSLLDNIYDKGKLYAIAESNNIPIPKTFCNYSDEDVKSLDLSFPVLIKGRFSLDFYKTTKRKAFIVENMNELSKRINTLKNMINLNRTIVQEVIPDNGLNKTISCAVFCINGVIKTHWIGIKLREHPLRFGTATYAESIKNEECYKYSAIIMEKLGYTGVCEIEFIKDPRDRQYKIIEINARTWLWVELAKVCGVDFAKIIYNYSHDLPIDFPKTYETGIKWINYLTDIPIIFQLLTRNMLTLSDYYKSLKGKRIRAVSRSDDQKPSIMFLLLSLYLLRKRII